MSNDVVADYCEGKFDGLILRLQERKRILKTIRELHCYDEADWQAVYDKADKTYTRAVIDEIKHVLHRELLRAKAGAAE